MPSFCRHGRLEANCPICSKQAKELQVRPARTVRRPASAGAGASASTATKRRHARQAGDLRVRRVARAADDGYEHELVPGLRASADAARLADELAFSAARLDELTSDPPGAYAEVALADDVEEAVWLAFLIAYLSPLEDDEPFASIDAVRTMWATGEIPDLDSVRTGPRTAHDPRRGAETVLAYRGWAARAGSQAAALQGDASWAPERRFERAYERLSLKGFGRAARYELLVTLGRLGVFDLRPTSLHLVEPLDPTVVAAKRVFGIGDAMNLRRRSAALANEAGLPIEALDLALVNWSGQMELPPGRERITAGARVTGADRRGAIAELLGVEGPEPEPEDE